MYQYNKETSEYLATLAIPCRNREQFKKVSRLNDNDLGTWLIEIAIKATGSALKYISMHSTNSHGEYIDRIRKQLPYCAHNHNYDNDNITITTAKQEAEKAYNAIEETSKASNIYTIVGNKGTKRQFTIKAHREQNEKERKALLRYLAKQKSLYARMLSNKAVYQSVAVDDIISATLISCYEWIDGNRIDGKGKYTSLYHMAYLKARSAIRHESIDNGRYTEMPKVTEDETRGIDNYIDYKAFSEMVFDNVSTADEILSDIDNRIKAEYPQYWFIWLELKENGMKAYKCSSRRKADYILNAVRTGYKV